MAAPRVRRQLNGLLEPAQGITRSHLQLSHVDGAQATGKHPMHRALRTTLWGVPTPACWRSLSNQRHGQRRASMSRGAATAAVAGARMRLHTCCHQGCPLPRPADCDAGAAAGRGGQRVHEERSTCAGGTVAGGPLPKGWLVLIGIS